MNGTTDASVRLVGIDLGTTNSALAWAPPRGAIRIFDVPQLVAAGEIGTPPTLPSFLYLPTDAERASGLVQMPWDQEVVAGVFARDHGALVPARQVSSAKSWLANPSVDRTAKLLPWGIDEGPRLSPLEASAHLLRHLRDAWNYAHARDDEARRLERQPIVLTVPASFDEEARELTVAAATDAGLLQLTLLEEPLAALYAWMAAHRRAIAGTLFDGALVLVCDVGGGTTDFSLIRARGLDTESRTPSPEPRAPSPEPRAPSAEPRAPSAEPPDLSFERIAIGEHLLLGGDNVDLALAVLVENKLAGVGGPRLTLSQRQTLRRQCSAAKEQLLSSEAADRVRITILGAGRGVVGGGMSADVSRDEVLGILAGGFLPITAPDDLPARDRRVGLRELGLPYESEPAITKHLAAFLTRAARADTAAGSLARPDAVLFNGGFFTPPVVRERLLDALTAWFGVRPLVLENARPEAAVAMGAAFYAKLRRDPGAARRLLIRAGSARAYYVGVATESQDAGVTAICVMPRGTDEGTTLEMDRELTVITNRPAAFTLYSSTDRTDPLNAVVTFGEHEQVHRHAPLVTALRYGKRSRQVPLGVGLRVAFTETGTLELWCESRSTDHRWRLSFNLRSAEADPLDEAAVEEGDARAGDQVIVPADAVEAAIERLRAPFSGPGGSPRSTDGAGAAPAPEALVGELENTLGHGKHAWPLATIRQLADVLLACVDGRRRSPAHEVRWLNLTGFCVRPGFGSPLDAWRISELRKVYAAGLAFPGSIQSQVEWLVLWQRVSAGFSAGQQRELAQRVAGQLGIGQRKPPRLNAQIDREGWRLLGSLERLEAAQRTRLGDELLDRVVREPRNTAWLWALGRFGARVPFYGPLSSVVSPTTAERWVERLLGMKTIAAEAASAVAQIAALTGDAARDIADEARHRAIERLREAGVPEDLLAPLLTITPPDRLDAIRVFGESLPEGLRLQSSEL